MTDKQDDALYKEPDNTTDAASASRNHDNTDVERRAILASLGKLAALTPPTVVTLMMTTRPAAAS